MKQLITNNLTGEVVEVDVVVVPQEENIVPEPTVEEQIIAMAEQLLATQEQLNSAQDALDFILMGGM